MKTLKTVKVGETVRVIKLHGEGAAKRRIMDMGLTKGVEVFVRRLPHWAIPLRLRFAATSFPFVKPMRK